MVKNPRAVWETKVQSLGWEDPLEEGMATHSNILAWRIHGQRSLLGYSTWGHKELDMTEWLSTAQHIKSVKVYTEKNIKQYKSSKCSFRYFTNLKISKVKLASSSIWPLDAPSKWLHTATINILFLNSMSVKIHFIFGRNQRLKWQ